MIALSVVGELTTRVENAARSAEYFSRSQARRTALEESVLTALPRDRPFTLEIGSGHGHFLNAYAAHHRDRFCVGIDIILDRCERAERKRGRANLTNLIFLRAEASEFLNALPKNVQLNEIFILFPDPWPKRRHYKNRLLQSRFLSTLAERAVSGARLYFRTDHTDYFDAALGAAENHPDWTVVPETWPFELATVFQSRAPSYRSWIASRR